MSKKLSIYQRLCAITPISGKGQQSKAWTMDRRLAAIGIKASPSAMSPYEAAVVACLDAEQQMAAAELALATVQQNFQTAEYRRNTLKAQLLLSGDSDEVWRVNQKYDLGYGDYPSEQGPKNLGFSGGK